MEYRKLNTVAIRPLPELQFPVACHSICISADGNKVAAVGVYKPTIKLFDLKAGSMKFERHMLCDPLKILSLEGNSEKFIVLRSDRTIEFHTKGGLHDTVRVPEQPRDVLYNPVSAELYFGGNYSEIYRFNMVQGRFLKSIPGAGTRMAWSAVNGLLGAVSKDTVVFIDSRSRDSVFTTRHSGELLSIAQDTSGLKYAVGNDDGDVLEYDLRSPKILASHSLGSFVQKLDFTDTALVAASDTRLSLIHKDVASVDLGFRIYDFAVDGGLILAGGEDPEIKMLFCEELGSAPHWVEI